MADEYEFSVDWGADTAPVWRSMIASIKPRKVLEVGAFEGRSAVFMIEHAAPHGPLELVCIDTWSGGVEHGALDMQSVEARFDRNIARAQAKFSGVSVTKIKSDSAMALAQLLSGHAGSFDVVYIDASHQAPDVLADAVLGFKLLRIGGVMAFDDYLWHLEPGGQQDLLNMPKPAIDAFVNIHMRKLTVVADAPLRQLFLVKSAH